MANKLRYHEGALRDLIEAARWYEGRSMDLGGQFIRAVELATMDILDNPLAFPRGQSELRSAKVKHFPYRIVFKVIVDRILILALAHTSRSAEFYKDRL